MVHNNSIMVAINPLRRNKAVFQKTLYVNDFYLKGHRTTPTRSATSNSSASSGRMIEANAPVSRSGR